MLFAVLSIISQRGRVEMEKILTGSKSHQEHGKAFTQKLNRQRVLRLVKEHLNINKIEINIKLENLFNKYHNEKEGGYWLKLLGNMFKTNWQYNYQKIKLKSISTRCRGVQNIIIYKKIRQIQENKLVQPY